MTLSDCVHVANTGAVTLTKPVSGNSSFLATATDRGLPRRQTTVPVFIYVLPVNRHAPRFVGGQQAFTATVPEDRPVGYVIGRVSAVDPDSGDNGVVRYYIAGGDEYFSVDAVDGTLAVARPLDYETRRRFDIELTARDLGVGGQSLEDRRVFTVMVADVNDNAPQFSHDIYSMSVDQDAPAGTTLGQLDASDSDRGLNAELRFRFVSGNASDVVDVGELDGAVTTGRRVLAPGLYVYVVEVCNPGTNMSSTTTVVINVRAVNQNAPTFRRRQYVFTLPNVTVLTAGVVVGAVDATDADSGDHGEVLYFLSGDSNLGAFAVHRRTGVLSVATTTPTSAVAAVSLTVLAKNRGPLRPGNFEICSVILRGGGSDGQTTLTFERQVYATTVREDAAVGDAVVKVSAFVVNPGAARATTTTSPAAVVFAIIGGNINGAFSIDSRTGLIRVIRKLHHDSLSKYNLTVSASINSAYPLTGKHLQGFLYSVKSRLYETSSVGLGYGSLFIVSLPFPTLLTVKWAQVIIVPLNNMKLVHWLLMGGMLHLVQQGGDWDWEGPLPPRPPYCIKNSPPINGQCTNHRIAVFWSVAFRFKVRIKGLMAAN